jgi:hypothetical protein
LVRVDVKAMCLVTYLRLLDADQKGADWQKVANINPKITSAHGRIFSASKSKRGNSAPPPLPRRRD